jgi:hypothetical protein
MRIPLSGLKSNALQPGHVEDDIALGNFDARISRHSATPFVIALRCRYAKLPYNGITGITGIVVVMGMGGKSKTMTELWATKSPHPADLETYYQIVYRRDGQI